jgi:tetratricopeptide (TPR) repeat protein
VEGTLAGRTDQLKEYVIGTEVFQLAASYNPQENPVVRIAAGRLRTKLAEYYLGAGIADPVVIEIPKGGYVPRFTVRGQPVAAGPLPAPPRPLPGAVCVGRERESNRLWSAFAEVSARGVMWIVSGDAGMGKTTLAEDFLAGVQVQSPSVWIGRGSSSERLAESDAYVPIFESLHTLLRGKSGAQAAQVMKAAAPSWYRQLSPMTAESPSSPPDTYPVSHERMRREILDFFEVLSRTAPVVLFLDDLHWADTSTCDLLDCLAARLRGLRIFILLTCRPTALQLRENAFLRLKLEWERRGISHELPLPFLSLEAVQLYIAREFPANRFPPGFAGVVHQRTEGNPLFMTSMLRFLQDRRILVEQDAAWHLDQPLRETSRLIPAGISSLIQLKLDQLEAEDLQLLTCAAIQGVQFDSAVIARALSLDPARVEERLQRLETVHNFARMVDEQEFPDRTISVRYQFVHVFYQNALYASLAPSRRAEQSRAVARALIALTGGTLRGVAADVALLFEAARDFEGAAVYFHHAARNAAALFAYPEAVILCERGLQALASTPESRERDTRELALLLILSLALMASRGYASPEVGKAHRRSLELCLQLQESRRLMPVLWGLHTYEVNAGNLVPALEVARRMCDLADESRDIAATVQSLHALGTTLAFMGRLVEALYALERIFVLQPAGGRPGGSLYLLEPRVTSLSMLARLLACLGYLDQALDKASESLALARQLAHPPSIAYATFWLGWCHHARADDDQSCRHLERAMTLAREHGLPPILEWGRVVRGSAWARMGRAAEGIAEIRRSLANQQSMHSLLERSYCLTLLAEALAGQGAHQEALAACEEALEFGRRTGGRCYEAETHRVRGEAMLALGGGDQADAVRQEFEQALRRAREQDCRLLELRAAVSYFRFHQELGDPVRGREVLADVAGWFVAGPGSPILNAARELLEAAAPR